MNAASSRVLLGGRATRIYYLVMVALLFLPIGVLLLFSFSASTRLSFPPEALTLDWYARVLANGAMLRSARSSLLVALVAATAATMLGTLVAIAVLRFRFSGRRLLLGLAALPLIVPFVVLGVALLLLFRALGVSLSLGTVAAAHTVVALPFALLIVMSRLAGFDRNLEEAAMDLGASRLGALRLVVLPIIAPAVVAGWIVAFTISFDEFALALFLAGTEPTFPVYLVSQLRFSNQLPILIALAVLLMGGTLLLAIIAERVRRIGTAGGPI